ncbi:MAG: cell division protein FtsQ/DivIB [Streptosporangiaceae bacterium]
MRAARERARATASVQDGNGAVPADPGDVAAPPSAAGQAGTGHDRADQARADQARADRDGADRDGADQARADRDGADRDGADRDGGGRRGHERGRLLFAAGLALVILAVAGWALLGPTLLVVRHVRVTGASPQVPAAAVREAAGIALGTPLARLDTAAATRRVERLQTVLSARVSRAFPDTVVIAVVPRVPALAVPAGSGYALVDSSGVTVSFAAAVPAGIPVLTSPPLMLRGSPAVRAAALVTQGLPAQLRGLVRAVSATGVSVTLQLAGGVTVVWGGPGQGPQKAAELSALLGTHARYYDVSDPATAVTGR